MRCHTILLPSLFFFALLACGLAVPAAAQFDEEEGFSTEDGSPADREEGRGEFRGRGERGERGGPGERGGRGPRPNPFFEALDADGDGMINNRELRQALKVLKSFDTDGDGNISLEEFSPRGPGGRGGDPNAMIDRMMENDTNGDGLLTQDEVPEQMARMLTGADTNGDQAIDRNELAQAMQAVRDNMGGGGFGGGGFGGRGMGGDPESMTKQVMSADQNGDGVITSKEMNPQMARMMQGADTNGDGALNAKEVAIYMETARQRMQQFRAQGGGRGEADPRERARRGRDQEQQ